jgi:hypothetical protein
VLTVLPAPAVGIRTSRSFGEGGQAERLDGTGFGENGRNPRPAARAVGVQLGVVHAVPVSPRDTRMLRGPEFLDPELGYATALCG